MSKVTVEPKEVVDDFLQETRDQKIKQLMGITIDKEYFNAIKGKHDVNKLRKQLSAEQGKILKDKGRIIEDRSDIEKIQNLNKVIDTVTKADTELARLAEMEAGIRLYLSFVEKVKPTTKKTLIEIASL